MKKAIIQKDLIIRITHQVPIREKAFFTLMRQSGLTPQTVKKLRIKSLEPSTIIPRRISTIPELKQRRTKQPPHFIGEEANIYIKQYLATRKNLKPENLLFASKNNPKKEISTKNVSRAFREALDEIQNEKNLHEPRSINAKKFRKRKFSLFSLIEFYRENTKHYKSELDNNPNEDVEYYRKLFKEKAMPFLEIESSMTITISPTRKLYQNEIHWRDRKIGEMKQTITRDSDYISSILTLLYNNKGDPETGENEEIGDRFIELWKEVRKLQLKNLEVAWKSEGEIKVLPFLDIVEELTKTLKRIKRPYDELERQTTIGK